MTATEWWPFSEYCGSLTTFSPYSSIFLQLNYWVFFVNCQNHRHTAWSHDCTLFISSGADQTIGLIEKTTMTCVMRFSHKTHSAQHTVHFINFPDRTVDSYTDKHCTKRRVSLHLFYVFILILRFISKILCKVEMLPWSSYLEHPVKFWLFEDNEWKKVQTSLIQ